MPLQKNANELKPGKFVEIVYTRALVEDYQKKEQSKVGEGASDSKLDKAEHDIPMKDYLHEIIFNMQALKVLTEITSHRCLQ